MVFLRILYLVPILVAVAVLVPRGFLVLLVTRGSVEVVVVVEVVVIVVVFAFVILFALLVFLLDDW